MIPDKNGVFEDLVLGFSSLEQYKSKKAKVLEPIIDRKKEVYTNEPGIQFYEGNFLDGSTIGKSNKPYNCRDGFCLETQHFPNSPNQSNFLPLY
jgi:aldose 1-epimerase